MKRALATDGITGYDLKPKTIHPIENLCSLFLLFAQLDLLSFGIGIGSRYLLHNTDVS